MCIREVSGIELILAAIEMRPYVGIGVAGMITNEIPDRILFIDPPGERIGKGLQ